MTDNEKKSDTIPVIEIIPVKLQINYIGDVETVVREIMPQLSRPKHWAEWAECKYLIEDVTLGESLLEVLNRRINEEAKLLDKNNEV